MKSDFPKKVFVQVVDREGEDPILSVESTVEDLSENVEDVSVGIYVLETVKKLTVTRDLQ